MIAARPSTTNTSCSRATIALNPNLRPAIQPLIANRIVSHKTISTDEKITPQIAPSQVSLRTVSLACSNPRMLLTVRDAAPVPICFSTIEESAPTRSEEHTSELQSRQYLV